MNTGYRQWLERGEGRRLSKRAIADKMARARRVEKYHGNLDEHYTKDRMAGLVEILSYSRDDGRRNCPNPSEIPFEGDIYTNLASYRDAVKSYLEFRYFHRRS